MVWGRHWLIVLFPIFCFITGFVFKILEVFTGAFNLVENVGYLVVYLSCILATTNGMDTKLGDYRRVIEVLVESSALHSVTLIIFVALKANGSFSSGHFDILAVMTTGIPLGRVAAGHARPDDSWEGSIISSLGFEVNAETYSQVSFISDDDLEAQSIQLDEPGGIGTEKRI